MGNCCCGPNKDEACGWPKNTIRSLLAVSLSILAFLMAAATIGILVWYQQYTVAVGVLGMVFSVISAIVAYYFGSKTGDAVASLATNMQNNMQTALTSRALQLDRMERGQLLHNNMEPVEVIGP